MYVQPFFSEQRAAELKRLIDDYPLGTLVSRTMHGVEANHLPFLFEARETPVLSAHLPRANAAAQTLARQSVLVIFHGPNAYVSPSAYPSKAQTGKAVPTWNYAVVHAYGVARVIEDKSWLRQHLERMVATHEGKRSHPWKISDAPIDYIEKLLDAIIGLEIAVERFEGKFKLGQNRSPDDRAGVLRDLDNSAPSLAAFTRRFLEQ